MDATKRAYLELHIAVFLWGFTAILGDLISLSALSLVWWRVLITSCSLIFLLRSGSAFRKLSRKTILQFAFVGALTGVLPGFFRNMLFRPCSVGQLSIQ